MVSYNSRLARGYCIARNYRVNVNSHKSIPRETRSDRILREVGGGGEGWEEEVGEGGGERLLSF